ncbi:MAG: carbohydrate kinase family protein [Deltaproteobacteria bacterium]|nr:carbohydrate kinase family protein [Deltaproteobacteria bacterium]
MRFFKCKDFELNPGSEIVIEEKFLGNFLEKLTRFCVLKKISPGGSASNACYMISLMGIDTLLFGVLGLDREGEFYLSKIGNESKEGIIRRGKTGFTYILNERSNSLDSPDRAIALVPNSNSDLKITDIDISKLSKCSWIHMSSFVSDSAMEAQLYVKEKIMGKAGLSLDPGEIYARKGQKTLDLIEGMDILFCSEKELCMLFGSDVELSLAKALKLVKIVIVKKGKEGASFYSREESYHVKAEKIRAVDTTGAGDVLDGVFLGLYLMGQDPRIALKRAVIAASESTKGYGRDSYPQEIPEA